MYRPTTSTDKEHDMTDRHTVTTKAGQTFSGEITINNDRGIQIGGPHGDWVDRADVAHVTPLAPANEPNRVTEHYSHAAPYILRQAAYAISSMDNAKTQKDRALYNGQVYGYLNALSILLDSPQGADSPVGVIADEDRIPQNARKRLREYLGTHEANRVLGLVPELTPGAMAALGLDDDA